MQELVGKVKNWFRDRGLNKGDPKKQVVKLFEELGELAGGVARNKRDIIIDSIGDILVVLIGLSLQTNSIYDFDEKIDLDSEEEKLLMLFQALGSISFLMTDAVVVSDDITESDMAVEESIMIAYSWLNAFSNELELSCEECLAIAYDEIKDRKGKLINGVFIKEEDLLS